MSKSIAVVAAFVLTTALVMDPASAAVVNYSTSFSDSNSPAFADGSILGQNGWSAFNAAHYIVDSGGAGLVGHTNAAGPVHVDTSADLTSELALGKTITMTLNAQFLGTYINQNNGRWMLGIGDSAATSQPLLGGGTFFNNGGTNFFMGDPVLANASKVDTGVAFDDAFHTFTTTITRTATTNEFAVGVSFDGGAVTNYTIANAGLWSGASAAYAGFRWQGNQSGNVDSFSVSSGAAAVPEPSSFALLGLIGVGIGVCKRRRKNR
ncbi:hypothetical protein Pla22_45790 [Rubripirellula amarantea]|uniref:Ice-binding protein C-terminal domain-containing protein n=1 Tax=Rubripirellula amarantea TaxID=2527999 RepID=A0A5C5WHA6_9BACT|nr:PEP-CTERM sorting domain-containing protein [Rubripirellula amarantea]TWT49383.1 hypothetical protein Pla22_45790 [Rubripirellula amarantea]